MHGSDGIPHYRAIIVQLKESHTPALRQNAIHDDGEQITRQHHETVRAVRNKILRIDVIDMNDFRRAEGTPSGRGGALSAGTAGASPC